MILTGLARLGADADLRYTQGGEPVATLRLAFNYGQKDSSGSKPTQWIEASLFGKRAPFEPEVAIGSVAESGWTYIAPNAAAVGADQDYIAAEKQKQLATIHSRRVQYTPIHAPIDPQGRVVIAVDDGLATGATMMAALHSLRQRQPGKLVCAIPVASTDALQKIRPMADEVVCLQAPEDFQAVGQFYRHFPQVDDEEVIALLRA